MAPVWFQPLAALVLACAYALALAARPKGERASLALRAGVIALAAWAGEETCIRIYRFYGYADGWWPMLSRVPLLVVAIWPMVIESAREVVGELWPDARAGLRAGLLALLIAIDASLMEVIAVAAGLWTWAEPGYLGVPVIGILGWVLYSVAIAALLDRLASLPSERQRIAGGCARAGGLAVAGLGAVALTHLGLVLAWWGGLRWTLRGDLGPWAVVGFALLPALLFACVLRSGRRLAARTVLARVLAASVFLALLASLRAHPRFAPLLAHTALVAAPYLWASLRGRPAPERAP